MRHLLLFVLLLGTLSAQTTIKLNLGGPATGGYAADNFVGSPCGGIAYTIAGQTGIYATGKYGAQFSCDVPAPSGSCVATLDLYENRAAGPDIRNDSGIGTRRFTVTLQGVTSPVIDIFAAVGALKPYQLTLPAVQVPETDKHLRFQFKSLPRTDGSIPNAVGSGLDINCMPTPPPMTGAPCETLRPTDGSTLAFLVEHPDGSCSRIKLMPALGFFADKIEAVWFTADKAGELKVQSVFTTLTPPQ